MPGSNWVPHPALKPLPRLLKNWTWPPPIGRDGHLIVIENDHQIGGCPEWQAWVEALPNAQTQRVQWEPVPPQIPPGHPPLGRPRSPVPSCQAPVNPAQRPVKRLEGGKLCPGFPPTSYSLSARFGKNR